MLSAAPIASSKASKSGRQSILQMLTEMKYMGWARSARKISKCHSSFYESNNSWNWFNSVPKVTWNCCKWFIQAWVFPATSTRLKLKNRKLKKVNSATGLKKLYSRSNYFFHWWAITGILFFLGLLVHTITTFLLLNI